MEELKIPIFIYTTVGIALCLTFIAIISKFEKSHPNLFTKQATHYEKLRYTQIVKTSVNIMLLYLIFAIFYLTTISYQSPPLAITILCGIFAIFVINNIITTFKKK
jgi:ABC-type bacteriocin/lantibiotic exporter with double-glycine peptidase domain